MCHEVITHTLACDIRPLRFNGAEAIVDTFTSPHMCDCAPKPEIKPWFRCELHGCCRVMKKQINCQQFETDNCNSTVELNYYDQIYTEKKLVEWVPARNMDNCVFPHAGMPTDMSSARQQSLNSIIVTMRQITLVMLELNSATRELSVARGEHYMSHWACEKSLSPLWCKQLNHVAQLQRMVNEWQALLDKLVSVYRTTWWLLQFDWETVDDLMRILETLIIEDTEETHMATVVDRKIEGKQTFNMVIGSERKLAMKAAP
ncbi:hypothetical protein EDB81DRAFT_896265 [Dactylonectria macrodidyma]|uniref:Uncharacterized protein n=1 Tax=Dactylonectria macrodidyma TaxID=307937 RepID=A0A9P9FSI1_9HYPO|nr:hypothetical protein EDB81DRAFT_896265 [Dactylonectria macrodidyma]